MNYSTAVITFTILCTCLIYHAHSIPVCIFGAWPNTTESLKFVWTYKDNSTSEQITYKYLQKMIESECLDWCGVTPCSDFVGEWTLSIQTSTKVIYETKHLFPPWNGIVGYAQIVAVTQSATTASMPEYFYSHLISLDPSIDEDFSFHVCHFSRNAPMLSVSFVLTEYLNVSQSLISFGDVTTVSVVPDPLHYQTTIPVIVSDWAIGKVYKSVNFPVSFYGPYYVVIYDLSSGGFDVQVGRYF